MKLKVEVYRYPGKNLSETDRNKFVSELKTVAASCFDEVPVYQVLTGEKQELDRAIITVARDENGIMRGFCSALILPLNERENIFHTGLTCVDPSARGKKLTHKLTSKALMSYLLRESLFKDTWISNCACVLSSIGNVAKHFENVYPSPFYKGKPTQKHIEIAQKISNSYRDQIAINEDSNFNVDKFVFEGSVLDTAFQKSEYDTRFFHRDEALTNFYKNLLQFDRGDEVLQIGTINLMSFPKYVLKRMMPKPLKVKLEELYAQ